MGVPLRILLVEDSENDALLLLRELRRGGYEPISERVDTAQDLEKTLDAREWDVVISDHSMPVFSSEAALDLVRRRGFADLPFIIVSGRIGEDAAVAAMKAGAQDYLMKDNLARLNSAIERELREAEVRRERRRAVAEIERQARLIDLAQDAIMVCDLRGTLRFWNDGAERMYGWNAEEALGRTAPDLLKTRYPERMEEVGRKIQRDGHWEGELSQERRDGTPVVVSSRWSLQRDERGEPASILEINTDVTARKRADEALRSAEERYRSIFENAVEGIFQTTTEGRFVIANPALARMFGYPSPEDLLENISSVADQLYVDPGRRTEFGRLIDRDGFVQNFEVRIRRGDGKIAWISVNARAVRDDGELAGYEGFAEDITERKRAEEALGEIREAERRRIARELHDVVLQDLTYALQSMQVAARMPEGPARAAEAGGQVEALRRSVAGIRDAIYDLRLESEEERTLARSLESIVELSRQMAPGCSFELFVEEGFPTHLRGATATEVARVIQEALANVRRHSGARRATISLGTAGEEAWIEVEDDGRGFGPDAPAGMGLTGIRERAQSLGGEVVVKSEPGRGTKVLLRLAWKTLIGDEDPERARA